MNHTPGPWFYCKNGTIYANDFKKTIVGINGEGANLEDLSNARLIAAAPELLEALRLCECELSLYVGLADKSNNPQAWHDAISAARRAIKSAII